MGSNLTGSRDFIKFIQASGKGDRKGNKATLAEAEACNMSRSWGRRNWASNAPEPMKKTQNTWLGGFAHEGTMVIFITDAGWC